MEKLWGVALHAVFCSLFVSLGCLIGVIFGGMLGLIVGAVLGWQVKQKQLDSSYLYLRVEYDYLTMACSAVFGLLFLWIYVRRYVWQAR